MKDKSNVHWIDRELVRSQVHYSLVVSEAAYKKEMLRLGNNYPDPFISSGANATTHILMDKKNGRVCMVTMRLDKDKTLIELYAILQHEAVHIFQEICVVMGEDKPSAEFQAYGIQRIALNLMYQFNQYIKRQPKEVRIKLLGSVCKS